MSRRRYIAVIGIVVTVCALALYSAIFVEQYYLVSVAVLFIGFIPLFNHIEKKDLGGRELVFIAVLSALGAVSRVPISFLPGVQPTSMIILATGWALGPRIGWIVGANVALVSNFFLGQGPWTPWQMLAWSLMGLTAGWLRHVSWMRHMVGKIVFGFLWGILFGWIMDIWVISGGSGSLGMVGVLQTFLASFAFDIVRAISNVVFIWWLWKPMEKILLRFQVKYGLMK